MGNMITFFVFIGILFFLISSGLGIYINGEKGRSKKQGAIIGGLFPFIGHIILALASPTDEVIVNEMYNRHFINKKEYEATKEVALKKR